MENQLSAGAEAMQANKERLTRDVSGMVNQASDLIKDYGSRKLDTARETFNQAQTAVTETAKQYADVTDEYVRANPWKALGVAAAAGLLIGILLTRR